MGLNRSPRAIGTIAFIPGLTMNRRFRLGLKSLKSRLKTIFALIKKEYAPLKALYYEITSIWVVLIKMLLRTM